MKLLSIPRKLFWGAFAFLTLETAGYGFDLTTVALKFLPQLETGAVALSQNKVAGGSFHKCQNIFFNGVPPIVPDAQAQMARPLCFDGFAVLHSGARKIPIFAAEVLNRTSLREAKEQTRTNVFFADARLPSRERASLDDFKSSGFDRGHQFPAGDAHSPESMAQSFSLANIVPQAPENNRGVWADYEKATRKYVMRAQGDVYVITGSVVDPQRCALVMNAQKVLEAKGVTVSGGPAAMVSKAAELSGGTPRHYDLSACSIGSGVVVPTYMYKLVFDSSTRRAWAYWIENTNTARATAPISYSELVQRTGINFLPGFTG